jgi:hypothetical protein
MAEPNNPALTPYLPLLRRFHAHETAHSGRHLLDHLAGVHHLLAIWGNTPIICLAGLFHSIYGTQIFTVRSAEFSDRETIRAIIGAQSERLAYLFCVTDRPVALLQAAIADENRLRDIVHGIDLVLEPGELSALLEIEIANFLEQPDDRAVIGQIRDILARLDPPLISASARAALDSYLAD